MKLVDFLVHESGSPFVYLDIRTATWGEGTGAEGPHTTHWTRKPTGANHRAPQLWSERVRRQAHGRCVGQDSPRFRGEFILFHPDPGMRPILRRSCGAPN